MTLKYKALADYLAEAGTERVPLTFSQVEEIIGAQLPMSARKHRPWWSNNPTNARITDAWLQAGYKSAQVDMGGEKLVFIKAENPPHNDNGLRRSLLGALKDEITIAAGVDLTQPALPEQSEQFEKKGADFGTSSEAS